MRVDVGGAMHPYLAPGEWLVTGRFFDPEGEETVVAGATVVHAAPEFPEILEVTVELRELSGIGRGRPERSTYRLEIAPGRRVRFRMDSLALGTLLSGGGAFTDRTLTLTYTSPDARFVGFEAFTAITQDEVITAGSFVAEGAVVKTWEVVLERVPPGREGGR